MARGIEIKTPEQVRVMRRAGLVVGRTLAALRDAATAGVTTGELDALARDELARAGATSSFLHYGGGWGVPPFPAIVSVHRYEVALPSLVNVSGLETSAVTVSAGP